MILSTKKILSATGKLLRTIRPQTRCCPPFYTGGQRGACPAQRCPHAHAIRRDQFAVKNYLVGSIRLVSATSIACVRSLIVGDCFLTHASTRSTSERGRRMESITRASDLLIDVTSFRCFAPHSLIHRLNGTRARGIISSMLANMRITILDKIPYTFAVNGFGVGAV